MGGGDTPNNIVALTAKEHYVAHLLLTRMYPHHHGVVMAFNMMLVSSQFNNRVNGRIYTTLKEKLSQAMKYNQRGERNSQYGMIWICNEEQEISKSIKPEDFDEFEHMGWKKGRKIKFDDRRKINTCPTCAKEFKSPMYQRNKFCSRGCQNKQNTKTNQSKTLLVISQLNALEDEINVIYGEVVPNMAFIKLALGLDISLHMILKYIGVAPYGANYETVHNRIKEELNL